MPLSEELVQRILSGAATLDEMAGVPIEEPEDDEPEARIEDRLCT